MVWLRIDDQIAHHPKFVDAGPIASWLWICGNAYCNKYLTDGFIQTSTLARLGAVTNARKWAERLVAVGLWDRAEEGYQVHDFHDFNPTAAQVRERREAERVTKSKAGRAGGVKSGESRRRSIEADAKQNGSRDEADAASGSEAPSRPVPSDPIPQTPSASSALRRVEPNGSGRQHGRIFLHRWQLDALIDMLGAHADGFALDEFLDTLTRKAAGMVLTKETTWPWVQAELTRECERRGLPLIAVAPVVAPSRKTAAMQAGMRAFLGDGS